MRWMTFFVNCFSDILGQQHFSGVMPAVGDIATLGNIKLAYFLIIYQRERRGSRPTTLMVT